MSLTLKTRDQVLSEFYTLALDAGGVRYCRLAQIWFDQAVAARQLDGQDEYSLLEASEIQWSMVGLLRKRELHDAAVRQIANGVTTWRKWVPGWLRSALTGPG